MNASHQLSDPYETIKTRRKEGPPNVFKNRCFVGKRQKEIVGTMVVTFDDVTPVSGLPPDVVSFGDLHTDFEATYLKPLRHVFKSRAQWAQFSHSHSTSQIATIHRVDITRLFIITPRRCLFSFVTDVYVCLDQSLLN